MNLNWILRPSHISATGGKAALQGVKPPALSIRMVRASPVRTGPPAR